MCFGKIMYLDPPPGGNFYDLGFDFFTKLVKMTPKLTNLMNFFINIIYHIYQKFPPCGGPF